MPKWMAAIVTIASVIVPLQATACEAPEQVELYSESHFTDGSQREAARHAAIRQGVIDALQRAAGAEISRGAQTATISSLTGVERESRDHLVIRSGGRVMGWEVLDEQDLGVEGTEVNSIVVNLRVQVCPSMDAPTPLVVAIGDVANVPAALSSVVRTLLAERLGESDAIAVVRDVPINTYHDIRIEFDHAVEVRKIDNSENVAILGRFQNPSMIDESALRFQLVSLTVTLSAVRFVDRRTISETIERRRRVPLDAPLEGAVSELVIEAAGLATGPLFEKLDAGALDYATP